MRAVKRSSSRPSWAPGHAIGAVRHVIALSGTVRGRAGGIRAVALASALALGVSGCLHVSGGIASSNIPIQGNYTVLKEVKGRDCAYRLLGFLPISPGNKTRNAMAGALGDAKGATALVNISVENWTHHWILFTNTCTEVHGTAVVVQ